MPTQEVVKLALEGEVKVKVNLIHNSNVIRSQHSKPNPNVLKLSLNLSLSLSLLLLLGLSACNNKGDQGSLITEAEVNNDIEQYNANVESLVMLGYVSLGDCRDLSFPLLTNEALKNEKIQFLSTKHTQSFENWQEKTQFTWEEYVSHIDVLLQKYGDEIRIQDESGNIRGKRVLKAQDAQGLLGLRALATEEMQNLVSADFQVIKQEDWLPAMDELDQEIAWLLRNHALKSIGSKKSTDKASAENEIGATGAKTPSELPARPWDKYKLFQDPMLAASIELSSAGKAWSNPEATLARLPKIRKSVLSAQRRLAQLLALAPESKTTLMQFAPQANPQANPQNELEELPPESQPSQETPSVLSKFMGPAQWNRLSELLNQVSKLEESVDATEEQATLEILSNDETQRLFESNWRNDDFWTP